MVTWLTVSPNKSDRNYPVMLREIDDKNAESIGSPIIEEAIQLLAQSNRTQLLERFPGLRIFESQEKFNEAAESLGHLGARHSIEYLDHLVKPGWDLLLWIVRSQISEKALMARIELTEENGQIKLTRLSFKNLHEGTNEGSEQESANGLLTEINSESTGKPFIENLVQSLMTSDFERYCQSLPEISADKLDEIRAIFEEAVRVLKPMGNMISFQYVTRAIANNMHTLFWKVRYQKEDTLKGWGVDK